MRFFHTRHPQDAKMGFDVAEHAVVDLLDRHFNGGGHALIYSEGLRVGLFIHVDVQRVILHIIKHHHELLDKAGDFVLSELNFQHFNVSCEDEAHAGGFQVILFIRLPETAAGIRLAFALDAFPAGIAEGIRAGEAALEVLALRVKLDGIAAAGGLIFNGQFLVVPNENYDGQVSGLTNHHNFEADGTFGEAAAQDAPALIQGVHGVIGVRHAHSDVVVLFLVERRTLQLPSTVM